MQKIAMENLGKLISMRFAGAETDRGNFDLHINPLLNKKNCLVSLNGEQPVAFVTCQVFPRTATTLWTNYASIEHLATDSSCRQRGHGSKLLQFALKKLKNEGVQFASLKVNDLSLMPYYQRLGFQVIRCSAARHSPGAELAMLLGSPKQTARARLVDAAMMRIVLRIDFPKEMWLPTAIYLVVGYVIMSNDLGR